MQTVRVLCRTLFQKNQTPFFNTRENVKTWTRTLVVINTLVWYSSCKWTFYQHWLRGSIIYLTRTLEFLIAVRPGINLGGISLGMGVLDHDSNSPKSARFGFHISERVPFFRLWTRKHVNAFILGQVAFQISERAHIFYLWTRERIFILAQVAFQISERVHFFWLWTRKHVNAYPF